MQTTMNTSFRHTRRLMAGFLAGMSCVGLVLAVLFLFLFSNGLLSTILMLSTGAEKNLSIWQAIGRLVSLWAQSLPQYLWDARWIILGVGLHGLMLAGVDLMTPYVRLRGRAYLGYSVTLGFLNGVLVGTLFTFGHQQFLFFGLVLVFLGAFLLWVGWLTWFLLWVIWLQAGQPRIYGPTSAPKVARAFLEAQARIGWLKRPTPPSEPNPYARPLPPSLRQSWIRFVLCGWAAITLLLVLMVWFYLDGSRGYPFGPVIGLTVGIWLTSGTIVLIEGLVVANWIDDNPGGRM